MGDVMTCMETVEMVKEEILKYYPDYKRTYGPYTRKDERKHLVLCKDNSSGTMTISWPKAKLEVKLKRRLSQKETADHIDGDITNNNYSNLQVLSMVDNAKKEVLRVKPIQSKCVLCGKEFIISRNQRNKRHDSCAGPFCSKSCTGKYSRAIQLGRGNKLCRNKIEREYFKWNKQAKISIIGKSPL